MAVLAPRYSALYPPLFSLGTPPTHGSDALIWPPLYPSLFALVAPRTGQNALSTLLLGDGVPPNRDEWTAEHWRQYAEYLERVGEDLLRRALARELELFTDCCNCRRKLSRKKQSTATERSSERGMPLNGLLEYLTHPRPKRGRKRGGENQKTAIACLAIRAELEASQLKRVTDRIAVKEFLRQQGKGAYRANKMQGVLSEMSRQRKLRK